MDRIAHVIGGGTVFHIRSHLALSAPAYGETARAIYRFCRQHPDNKMAVRLYLSKMARTGAASEDTGSSFETHEELTWLTNQIVADPLTKLVFFNAAVVDFGAEFEGKAGKYEGRSMGEIQNGACDCDECKKKRAKEAVASTDGNLIQLKPEGAK